MCGCVCGSKVEYSFVASSPLLGYDWTLLDDQYLPYQASRADVHSWQEFFSQLGVATFLIVRREEVRFRRDEIVCMTQRVLDLRT